MKYTHFIHLSQLKLDKILDFFIFLSYTVFGFKKLQKGGMTAGSGKYRIVSRLCEHSDTTVWLAEHTSLNVKRIIKGIKKSSPYHDRLVKEAHLLKNLKHPFIPEIYDLDEDNDYTYIIWCIL